MARGEQVSGERTGPVFEARFDSDCADGDTIDAGELIVMHDGDPWHIECAKEAGLRVPGDDLW